MKRPLHLLSALAIVIASFRSYGALPPRAEPLPNYDRRESPVAETSVAAEEFTAAARLRTRLPRVRVDYDPILHAPRMISAVDGFLTGADGAGGAVSAGSASAFSQTDPYQPTKAFLQEYRDLFGYGAEVLTGARVTREFTAARSGLTTVVWQQEVDGIRIFEALLISHTTRAKELVNLSSSFVPDPDQTLEQAIPNRANLIAVPPLAPEAAVAVAATNVGETLTAGEVAAVGDPAPGPEREQRFQAPPLSGQTVAHLTWLPMNRRELRLCWDILLTSRSRGEMFRVLVDAQTGEVLVRHCLTEYLSDATYLVYTSDSPSPFSPGYATPMSAQPSLVSRTAITWAALSTNASPAGWIDDGDNQTLGNNVDAHTDRNDDDQPDLPRPQGSPSRVFSFSMDPSTDDPTIYSSAAVVQLFYWCNWMHDKLYDLGFTEAAGNFQTDNFSRGGLGGDALQADAQDGGGYDNANMSTPSDGYAPRMQMYLFDGPSPRRDGDFDAEIVLHEYTHGLSNRRVGGGVGLTALQSRGMGEGWSDFYALALLSEAADNVDGNYAAAAYASYLLSSGFQQNYYFGIRRYPYTTDMTKNPLTFKDIDPSQADYCSSGAPYSGRYGSCSAADADEVHNQGEVWCVMLWEARAALIHRYGWATGNQLILQLVTDAMNLSPANPNFVQARDAILQADLVDSAGANQNTLWAAFAKRGLGLGATSPSSSSTIGVHEAFDVPDDLHVTPTDLAFSGPVGGPFAPNPAYLTLTNIGSSSLNWTLGCSASWLNVSPGSGSLSVGGPPGTVTVTVEPAATNLPLGQYTEEIRFTNQTSGVAQSCPVTLTTVGRSLYDSFDPGIDLTQWSAFGGTVGSTVLATNYGGYVSGPNSLWFGDSGSRFATTIPVDTSLGGTVSFSIRLADGTSSTWEHVDLPSEGVVLEVSTNNGASWVTLVTCDTTAYYTWTPMVLTLPAAAQAPTTWFRWRQLSHSGTGYDHWALDNVSIDAGPTPPRIFSQPTNQTAAVGGIAILSVGAGGSTPLAFQWQKDGVPISGATASSYVIPNVQTNDAGVYCVVVTNTYGRVTSSNAVLTVVYASVPDSFDPGANATVYCTALQRDGKILVGGSFTTLAGQSRSYLARLNPDGTLDPDFNPGASSAVYCLAVQEDGKILVGGGFALLGGQSRSRIGRLNEDGSLDTTFNPGASSTVYSLALQADGKILVGGNFGSLGGQSRYYLGRLNPDGTLDSSFNPAPGGSVYALALQADGKIVAGGGFTTLGGQSRYYLGRINADGSLDTTFNPGAGNTVYSLALQGDGKILVGGYFTTLAGQSRSRLGRLNPDGSLDTGFNPGASSSVYTLAVQANGKILVGGAFTTLGAQTPRAYLGRLDADGTVDSSFDPGANSTVYSLALQADGKVLVGGGFTTLGGLSRTYLGRLTSTEPALQDLVYDGSTATWQRGGSTPEVCRAVFEGSTDGTTWSFLGTGSRVSGGWQLAGLTWPTNAALRVYGTVAGGYFNGSGWLVGSGFGPPVIVGQPQSQTAAVGATVTMSVSAEGSAPLTFQWQKDGVPIPGAIDSSYVISNVTMNDAGVYSVVVSNSFSVVTSSNAVLTTIYVSAPDAFNPGANGTVYCTALQPDGKILMGGNFNSVGGLSRDYLARLNPDGTLDPDFNPGASSAVYCLAVQEDGKILVGGGFALLGGQSRSRIGRLNEDGSLDTTFNPGASSTVYSLALQADGKILVGGSFGSLGGQSRYYLGRLNPDGTLDSGFNPAPGSSVYALALQADGKIVAGGGFTTLGGQSRYYLGRLNSDGTLDTGFNPGASSSVYCLAVQSDGGILVGGGFTTLGGQSRARIGRLNPDGTPDAGFNPGANDYVYSLIVQADGRILVGGYFTTLGNQSRSRLGRLEPGGDVDGTFATAANSVVCTLALQPDGKVLVGGSFSTLDGQSRPYLGRLTATTLPTESLTFDGTTITWLRGGSGPEVWRTEFEGALDGTNWIALGAGTRVSGGWQLTGLSGSIGATLRARGFVAGGIYNGSGWFVETVTGPPIITNQPVNQFVRLGLPASFDVGVSGLEPLSFQWRRFGAALTDATNSVLRFSSVTTNNAGDYDVVVANSFGAITSTVATLTVYVPTPPVILQQPLSQTVSAGTNVTFIVEATGDMPLAYQWSLNGVTLAGATNSSLSLTNVQAGNAGDYRVAITNVMGSQTSLPATLVVLPAPPLITLQPRSQGVFPGFDVGFSAAARGSEPFTWQWRIHGLAIQAATNAWLTLTNVRSIQAGIYSVVVSNSAGSRESAGALLALVPVASWGWNSDGQTNLPAQLTDAVQVSAGAAHNVALCRDGSVVAWGAAGQTQVPSDLGNVAFVAAGGDHSLALTREGTVVVWGSNPAGQSNLVAGLSNVVAVAAGGSHDLALMDNGLVVAWGDNAFGQTDVPSGLTNVIAIAAGSSHSIALQGDGLLVAWGLNSQGQCDVPPGLTNVVAIAAGGAHNLALRLDGTVVAWGMNTYGQTNVPAGLSNVVAIAGGAFHSLAVKSDGTLVAWGAGADSNLVAYPHLHQSIVPSCVTNIVGIAGGTAHTLALAGDGAPFIAEPPIGRVAYSGRTVVFRAAATGALPLRYQWQFNGLNIEGATNRLLVVQNATHAGNYRVVVTNAFGTATSRDAFLSLVDRAPFVVTQPTGASVWLGAPLTLQVRTDGSGPFSYQWRLNGVDIPGATNAVLVLDRVLSNQAGHYSVVIHNSFGAVSSVKVNVSVIQMVAWGAGTNDSSSPNYGQSMVPAGLDEAVSVSGGGYHTLAAVRDGSVAAWGAGAHTVGVQPHYGQCIVPVTLEDVKEVAAGLYHSLALKADGTVVAWGAGTNDNYSPHYGQSMVPEGLTNITGIAAGDYHSVALRNDGRVVVWGYNGYGVTNVPAAATNVFAVASMGQHVLALREDGSLVQWGSMNGALPGYSNVLAIATGVNHCLALMSDGTVESWGGSYPVPPGLSNVVAVAAGYDHSLALRSDGTVVTWGYTNTYGRGDVPDGLVNVRRIACGRYHSIAALGDGSVELEPQPAERSVYLGTATTINALALGAPPLAYQWQFNGVDLSSATNAVLTLADVKYADAGRYTVRVSNAFSSATGSVATLTVLTPMGVAVEATNLVWTGSGDRLWFVQTAVTHDAEDAAQSGFITDSQSSSLQAAVTGPGTLHFWWKVSSEEWFDYLTFQIDGQEQSAISGEVDWEPQTFVVSAGVHALEWTYSKDESESLGADAGWLDQVTYIVDPPVITLQPSSQTVWMGSNVLLTVNATGAPPINYYWFKHGNLTPLATGTGLTLVNVSRSEAGTYSVSVLNPGGTTVSSNAQVSVLVPQRLNVAGRQPDGSFVLLSSDADGGWIPPADLPGFEVQTSTNLQDWVSLPDVLTLTNGSLLLRDPDSTNHPVRFYRIIEH